jgi:subtilisin-like proprotein convertase family protein
MKRVEMRWLVAVAALGLAIFLVNCGGGGGGGPGPVQFQDEIALFADDVYVDYRPGEPVAEASNLEAALRTMGHTVIPFTGTSAADFTAALSDKRILVIPELEGGSLNAVLDTAGRGVISDFVTGGGTLLLFNDNIFGSGHNVELMNSLFGHSLAAPVATVVGTITRNDPDASGTAFEDRCPAALDTLFWTTLLPSPLPTGSRSIYVDGAGNSALALIPEGNGQVIVMGWDGLSARPVGIQDGGWWSVLYRAVSMDGPHPDVALVSDDAGTVYAADVVEKLKASGQFARVDTIDAAASTPGLNELLSYDAVMVYSGIISGFNDTSALGNVMADYIDRGGGLVTAGGAVISDPAYPEYPLGGRYATDQYYLIQRAGFRTGSQTAGPTMYKDHPLMAGYLTTFDGGINSARADTTMTVVAAAEIVEWADGVPLVATGEINGTRRVDLGFHPVSSDADPNLWDASTDGDKLMANALTWVANIANYRYDSYPATITSPSIPDGGVTSFAVTVSGGPESISRVRVTVNISHTANEDVDISLTSPGGATVELSTDNGGLGNGYAGATFEDAAARAADSFAGVDHNFSGSYIPEESLSAFIGTDSNGTWTLGVSDDTSNGETGALNSWTLHVR